MIGHKSKYRSATFSVDQSSWDGGPKAHVLGKKNAYILTDDSESIFTHEGGHLLELEDAYGRGGYLDPSYGDNRMGSINENADQIFESDIDNMLNYSGNTVIDLD